MWRNQEPTGPVKDPLKSNCRNQGKDVNPERQTITVFVLTVWEKEKKKEVKDRTEGELFEEGTVCFSQSVRASSGPQAILVCLSFPLSFFTFSLPVPLLPSLQPLAL